MRIIIITTCFAFLVFGCVSFYGGSASSIIAQEMVLSPGMKICAVDNGSHICIVAGENNKRTISLNGKTQTIYLVPRTERWYGTLGLVSPNHPLNLWEDDKGVSMANIEEAQIHYKSIEAVEKSLTNPFNKRWGGHEVYNDDGLSIHWKITQMQDRQNIFDLSIYQILINGKKPKKLSGSSNSQIWLGEDRQ